MKNTNSYTFQKIPIDNNFFFFDKCLLKKPKNRPHLKISLTFIPSCIKYANLKTSWGTSSSTYSKQLKVGFSFLTRDNRDSKSHFLYYRKIVFLFFKSEEIRIYTNHTSYDIKGISKKIKVERAGQGGRGG